MLVQCHDMHWFISYHSLSAVSASPTSADSGFFYLYPMNCLLTSHELSGSSNRLSFCLSLIITCFCGFVAINLNKKNPFSRSNSYISDDQQKNCATVVKFQSKIFYGGVEESISFVFVKGQQNLGLMTKKSWMIWNRCNSYNPG